MCRTALVLVTLLVAACGAPSARDASAREWQRAECDRVIDEAARVRCLKRVDDDYGRMSRDREEPRKK